MNSETRERFQAWRRKNPGVPIQCFKVRAAEYPFEWEDQVRSKEGMRVARWQDDVFRYVVTLQYDDMPSDPLDYLGEFTDEGRFPETIRRDRSNVGWNSYKRFRPQYSIKQIQEDLHRAGVARGPAYARAVEDARATMARAESFGDDWWSCGLIAEVFLLSDDGEEDPRGTAALWGIESDSDEKSLSDTAMELATEAAAEARRQVEADCRDRGQQHFTFFAEDL